MHGAQHPVELRGRERTERDHPRTVGRRWRVIRRGVSGALLVTASLASGCYLAHERVGAAPACTGGLPMVTAPSLPPIDDAPVPPGARPSDGAAAAEWAEPPRFPDGDCCTVAPIGALGDRVHRTSAPVITWNGETFGVVWGVTGEPGEAFCPHAIYQELDADAEPVTEELLLDGLGAPAAIAWASDRYLLAAGPPRGGPSHDLAIFDRRGEISELAAFPDQVTAIARHRAARAWIVASHAWALDESSPAQLRLLDDRLVVTTTRAIDPVRSRSGVRLAVLESRLVVHADRPRGVELEVFDDGAELTQVTRFVAGAPGALLVAWRDSVIVGGVADPVVNALTFDPFSLTGAGPRVVAREEAEWVLSYDGALASDSRRGTIAMCWSERRADGAQRIRVRLLDRDGEPLGMLLEIRDPSVVRDPGPGVCALASNDDGTYVMVFSGGLGERPTMFATAIHVRRD